MLYANNAVAEGADVVKLSEKNDEIYNLTVGLS